jgi:hypothetical protein
VSCLLIPVTCVCADIGKISSVTGPPMSRNPWAAVVVLAALDDGKTQRGEAGVARSTWSHMAVGGGGVGVPSDVERVSGLWSS